MNIEKRILKIEQDCFKNAQRKKRKCLIGSCEKEAINSHLLQKNGILNYIAKNGHVYEVGIDFFSQPIFKFKKIGIKRACAFPLLCNTHDTTIFKEIEINPINFYDYKSQLLFSMRSLMSIIRKKEIVIDAKTCSLNNSELMNYLAMYNPYKINEKQYEIIGSLLGIIDSYKIYNIFLEDLYNGSKNFSFQTLELRFTGICASGVFSFETTKEISSSLIDYLPTEIFFNIIPQAKKSYMIIGVLKNRFPNVEKYIEYIMNDKSYKSISDILLRQIEIWYMSEDVYTKLKPIENEIIEEIIFANKTTNERIPTKINIFDYIT